MRRKTYSSPKDYPIEKLTWLAGVLEGHGSYFQPPYKYPNNVPKIVIILTDREVIDEVAEMFGVSVYTLPRQPDWRKDRYRVMFSGEAAVEWMNALYPHLKSRKRYQIDKALQKLEAYS
jgi:hypothetical protein